MNYRQTFLQALFIFCKERGLDIDQIASRSGFKADRLNSHPEFKVSDEQVEMLWTNIIAGSGNQLVGLHFGATMQIAALSVVGQIIQTSSTVRDALQQARSLIHLFTDFYTMQVEEHAETFTIQYRKNGRFDSFPITQEQMGGFLVAFSLYELKGLLIENPKPIQIGIPTFSPAHRNEYESILKCPVRKTDDYTLEFRREFLNTPIISANYEIQNILINQINQLHNPTELSGDFSKRIFNFLVANSFLYSLSIEAVAGNFNLSVRTLQRKLKDEGVSYLQIVEEVRKSLAIHYIQNTSSSVKEISFILGYAEPSGFVRAFKKWTGRTPAGYRNDAGA